MLSSAIVCGVPRLSIGPSALMRPFRSLACLNSDEEDGGNDGSSTSASRIGRHMRNMIREGDRRDKEFDQRKAIAEASSYNELDWRKRPDLACICTNYSTTNTARDVRESLPGSLHPHSLHVPKSTPRPANGTIHSTVPRCLRLADIGCIDIRGALVGAT